jgi:quinol monooxygenase YgiN
MIIVGGTFEVDPSQRERFVTDRHELMRTSRAEQGCIDYAFCADPIEPGRVLLFERWETQADLNAHLEGMGANPPATGDVAASSVSVVFYDAEPQGA